MKIKICLIIFVMFLFSCVPDNNTSLIKIYNLTGKDITNFKIGDNYVFASLSASGVYDYWISSIITGKITADNIDNVTAGKLIEDNASKSAIVIQKDNPDCIFMLHYEYHIDLINDDNGVLVDVRPGISPGKNTDYHYPAN
ncbi:MAG: hypothetical protein A2015_17310 [Spirochaetes bacterium GWF1_31_7]|nr:MAG: hypothetical protein A2Y30_14610 [Spirochaetes bacterium GWE1_32_154]OHD46856.1 MAG: hypothetical protein A2015_17310 [Spirochaetes bacterium GWF1_31_7]OHD50186.1 MAG: hypothetical protein A2Y29_12655 [Spirochaetes bacterium GWE2_31_10]HBD94034.1 hypothetical protein [Spirochaetia bacterium]HBI38659.1 hypothetical protein [Spirochaetia bacterium]